MVGFRGLENFTEMVLKNWKWLENKYSLLVKEVEAFLDLELKSIQNFMHILPWQREEVCFLWRQKNWIYDVGHSWLMAPGCQNNQHRWVFLLIPVENREKQHRI